MSRRGNDLSTVTAALGTLAEQGGDLIGDDHLREIDELRERIRERLRHGDALTVVAVAGGTGAGKSALVNRLAGAGVATEGVRRPTTDHAVAVASGFDASARALLDHLGIDDRRVAAGALPPELVLVDLPDHDSVVEANRATSARLAARVDALLVVVDPIKYARADLHDGPLADLSRHADVVTVVLNRIDEVDDHELEPLREDLQARLAADGLEDAEVIGTSAATGAGIDAVRGRLRDLAEARSAAVRRLLADAAQLADRILRDAGQPVELTTDPDRLLAPLLGAVDVDRTTTAAAVAYGREARQGCRSPLARSVGLVGRIARQLRRAFVPDQVPPPPPSRSTATIEAVLARHLQLTAATGREHASLAATVDHLARDAAPAIADAVGSVRLQPGPRAWWTLLAASRGVAEVVALGGLTWLVLLGLSGWLQLPEVPTPDITQGLSWPAGLLLYGGVGRVVLGLVSRGLTTVGARRHAARIEREVRRRVSGALREHVLAPVEADLRRRRTVRAHLAELARGTADARRR